MKEHLKNYKKKLYCDLFYHILNEIVILIENRMRREITSQVQKSG